MQPMVPSPTDVTFGRLLAGLALVDRFSCGMIPPVDQA
jgi:hypothetical protein